MNRRNRLPSLVLVVLTLALSACAGSTPPESKAAGLVDQARWTVESFKANSEKPFDLFRRMLPEAQGIAVFPGTMKAGFLVGAEYGDGILIARDANGQWSYPAFYTLGGGSVGLQIGGQVAEIVLVIRNRGAVESLVRNQGKLGADLEVTVGTVGAGMEGATTTHAGADIVVFSSAAGVFAGGSIEGSVFVKRNDYNAAFYGNGATPQAILFENRFSNPKADALRAALSVR